MVFVTDDRKVSCNTCQQHVFLFFFFFLFFSSSPLLSSSHRGREPEHPFNRRFLSSSPLRREASPSFNRRHVRLSLLWSSPLVKEASPPFNRRSSNRCDPISSLFWPVRSFSDRSCNGIKCLVMELMYVYVSWTDNHASVMSCAFLCHGLISGSIERFITEWSSGSISCLLFHRVEQW